MDCKPAKGTRDLVQNEVYLREMLINKIKKYFELYGGIPLNTPVIERMDIVKNLYGEEFNKQVYTLDDDGGEKLFLRYDLTVPLARYISANGICNLKRYQIDKVYRKDNPEISKGRYREFYQADFDIIGTDQNTFIQDIEILCLLNNILSDIIGNKFIIMVNNKKLLFDVLTFIGANLNDFNTICSSLDKLDKISWEEIKNELLNIKKINEETVNKLNDFISLVNNFDFCSMNKSLEFNKLLYEKTYLTKSTYEEINQIFTNISKIDNLQNVIKFNPILSRGLSYYTGIIFEASYCDKNIMASSIAAGGRYDNMLEKFGNKGSIPAIGMSIGLERIVTILENIETDIPIKIPKFFIATIGENMELNKMLLANELRKNNIFVDYFYNKNPKMRQQLDYVFKIKIPYMLIIGEDEIKNNKVKLKCIEKSEQYVIDRENLINKLLEL